MRTLIPVCLLLLLPTAASFAQTRTPSPTTPEQEKVLRAAVALNDQGKVDEAIAQYQAVLAESPDNVMALYELAYSYAEKKDFAKSAETAKRGTEYKSELLASFYDVLASALDSSGQTEQAIAAYEQGIKAVPDAGTLYHNLAVTYLETVKNRDEARKTLQRGELADPLEPSIPLMLGQVFKDGGYTTPSFFAYAMYLILEPGGPRSLQAFGNWRAILKGGVEAPIAGVQDGVDSAMRTPPRAPSAMPARSDEGDFADFDAQFPLSQRALLAELNNDVPEMQALINQVNRLLLFLQGRALGRDRQTFTGRMYLPYFRELKERNYVEPFVYWISQRAPTQGVREWLLANQTRVRAFLDWTKTYPWPKS